MRHPLTAFGGPVAPFCRQVAQGRRIRKWSNFYETHHFYTEFRVESDGNVHFDKKVFYILQNEILYSVLSVLIALG